ncbi:hypothetical protein OROGR_015023 [Orobanche gracilis]
MDAWPWYKRLAMTQTSDADAQPMVEAFEIDALTMVLTSISDAYTDMAEYLDAQTMGQADFSDACVISSEKLPPEKRVPRPVDLSEVVDFRSILEKYNCSGELVEGVSVLKCDFDQPIFCLESRPGFYYIPAALSLEEQCQWIRESLTSFPQPPNLTNHNAIYGPIENLFVSAKEGKVLVFEDELPGVVCSDINVIQSDSSTPRWKFVEAFDESSGRDACKSVSASVLLRKLRWSTLGLQFDWSKVSLESFFTSLIVYFGLDCASVSIFTCVSDTCEPPAHVALIRRLS